MVALAYSDITTPAPRAVPAPKRLEQRPVSTFSDPVVDVATRLLSVPLRQAYAWLWRAGVLVIDG
jgi:hypothetical protein